MLWRDPRIAVRVLCSAGVLLLGPRAAPAEPAAPVIEHAPVRAAMPGQDVTIRAHVTGPAPKSMALFLATSKDAAPFKLPMSSAGPGIFAGSIPESMLARLSEAYYYIEARDAHDAPVETPWYTIQIRAQAAGKGAGGAAPPSAPAETADGSWVKPALIGGGILAAGGIAYALSSGGGGGGGGSGGGGPSALAGTYIGTDTTCFQPPGGGASCDASGLTMTISDQGVVQSEDLREGARLEAFLSGTSFVLVADVNEDGLSGEIQYVGTVVDNRIVGSVQGSASSSNGVGVFSGSFSAVK